jgi:hypothetical protein
MGRVDECDTALHQPVQDALPHELGGPREVGPGVDAERLLLRIEPQCLDPGALADGELHDVGEVDLALGIVVIDLGEQLPEQIGAEQIHAGIALLDLELLWAGVRGLDDAGHAAAPVPDHDAGHLYRGRQQHQVGAGVGLVADHGL